MERKRCSICDQVKPVDEFYVNHKASTMPSAKGYERMNRLTTRPDRHRPECKDCTLTKMRVKRQLRMVDLP